MTTKAVKVDGGYHLSGSKMWISNAPVADIAIVWAKLDGIIRGFIIDRKTAGPGLTTPIIRGQAFAPRLNNWVHTDGQRLCER